MIFALLTRFRVPLLVVLALLAVGIALRIYVASEVKGAENAAAVEVLKNDAKADDVAGQVAATERSKVEKENDDARKAANAGDDRLRDGLNSLRRRKAGSE